MYEVTIVMTRRTHLQATPKYQSNATQWITGYGSFIKISDSIAHLQILGMQQQSGRTHTKRYGLLPMQKETEPTKSRK